MTARRPVVLFAWAMASGLCAGPLASASGCGEVFPDHRFEIDALGSDAPESDALPDGASDAPHEVVGIRAVSWTVVRNAAPATCADLSLTASDVTVAFTAAGAAVRQARVPCIDGHVTVEVPLGQYQLEAFLGASSVPAELGIRYVRENHAVSGDGPVAIVLAQADVTWTWEAASFSGCTADPQAVLRVVMDGAEIATAACAAEQAAGRAPAGARLADVHITGATPSQHVVEVDVPLAGGVVPLAVVP